MTRTIEIDRKSYILTNPSECQAIPHDKYNTLRLYTDLDRLDRLIYFVYDLVDAFWEGQPTGVSLEPRTAASFGGYLVDMIERVSTPTHPGIWIALHPDEESKVPDSVQIAITCEEQWTPNTYFSTLPWKQVPGWFVHIHPRSWSRFQYIYYRNIHVESHYEAVWDYENLIHMVMIVKNAGKGFKEVLEKNLPHIDRWTILDTGSTDETMDIIREVLETRVRGKLYQEPFVDFGTTRNRALELAGCVCKYVVMLDDTYFLTGNLRGFIAEIQSDQFADSYSLYIQSSDVQYASNRMLKSIRTLRYKFKIHEVVSEENNVVVIVPPDRAQIHDEQSDYMQKRTSDRKTLDLKLLRDSITEDFENPRHWYYMAQTYVCLEDYENAYKYFLARVFHPKEGFLQEKIDACFEAARTAQYKLRRPWDEVRPLYERAYALDPTRPDSVYFLGIQALMAKDPKEAYTHFKKAFEIGYPLHAQYSLKPTLSFQFTPRFLSDLCYQFADYALGKAATHLFLEKNPRDPHMESWYSIYHQLKAWKDAAPEEPIGFRRSSRPRIVFVADGNWAPWTGADILTKGLGGSETYIVEMARWIQRSGEFEVLVFCRSSHPNEPVLYDGVTYLDLKELYGFVHRYAISSVIISRFSEYIPMMLKSPGVDNVFVVVHDLSVSGLHIHMDPPKLRQIFVLTEWHKKHFTSIFSTLESYVSSLHYGIDYPGHAVGPAQPTRWSRFIYSSFPNRGLLPLLHMWPRIRQRIPHATLDLYVDLSHRWTNDNFPELVKSIRAQLERLHDQGITVHGWVSKAELYKGWKQADVWLYPCIFQETFCLTALEAAASHTLAITSDLAALQDTVGDRGFLISGNPTTEEWQDRALACLDQCLRNPDEAHQKIAANRQWAVAHSWQAQANQLLGWLRKYPLEYRGSYTFASPSQHPNAHSILAIVGHTGLSLYSDMQKHPSAKLWIWSTNARDREALERNLVRLGITASGYVSAVPAMDKVFDVIQWDGPDTACAEAFEQYHRLEQLWERLSLGGRMSWTISAVHEDATTAFLRRHASELNILVQRVEETMVEKKL